MEKVKFRAWDKDLKVMDYGNGEVTGYHEWETSIVCILNDIFVESDYNIELMQSTGLKDKNGKEIYEGDIVDIRYAKSHHHKYRKIYYDRGAFRIDDKYSQHDLGLYITDKIEVVGNIYENPELLELLKND